MSVLNVILFITSYLTAFNPSVAPHLSIPNIKMNMDDNMLNSSYKFANGLKLFSAKETKEMGINWLYNTLDNVESHPTFVLGDIVSTITYTLKEPDKYDLYIAYMPDRFEEPHFIGCFSIKPDKRLLSIEQICTNPLITDTSLTDYKKRLTSLASNSNVLLYPQPLKYLINPRYYLEFTQSL